MLNQLKKNYLLIAASLVLLLLSYQFAFKKTLEAWRTGRRLQAELAQAAGLDYQPGYQQRKNRNLGQIIRLYQADTAAFRNNSISVISIIAQKENVKLAEVPTDDPFFHTDKMILQKLSFEGDFFALARTLHNLQSTSGIGIIRSASYKLVTNRSNTADSKKLMLEVWLEIAK